MKYDAFTKDELVTLIELRNKDIGEKNRIIERLNHNIELRDEVVNTRNNQIVELNNTINEFNEQLINKDKLLKKYKKTITDNENNLSLKNDRIQELEMTLNDVKAQRDAIRNAKAMDTDVNSIIAHKEGVIRDLKIMNEGLAEKIRSKDFKIDFLQSKVDWLSSMVALKETKESEVKNNTMYLMPAANAVKLCDGLNLIEERLNVLENYIFGGNKND
jgi:chromosome segregation ATPase